MVSVFQDLGLQPQFMQAVEQLGFDQPTPIQEAAIPALLAGRDVVGQAQTGTGKTAAFAFPMLQSIKPGSGKVQALILTPTRELAIQVAEATSRMAQNSSVRVLAVYGGQAYHIQVRALQRGVEVVVGTPGRLLDLVHQKILDLSQARFVVLDEADEMLEMGFIDDVTEILSEVPDERQIALFSATLPKPVRKLAERYLHDPQEISINPTHITVAETDQRYYSVREEDKLAALTRLLEVEDVKSSLVFARTKARAQELAEKLSLYGLPAESLHGDLSQERREAVLNRFRKGKVTLLIATDVAARGLDVDDISHVFNYDLPGDPEDYVHRIGRTGRAGRKGIAILFITPKERFRLKQIESFTRQTIRECKLPTREEILARRDLRFIERLTAQLGKGSISRERAMIASLGETSYDMVEIAAAAIQLARSIEPEAALEEIHAPAAEARPERRSERPVRKSYGAEPTRADNGYKGASRTPGKPGRTTTGQPTFAGKRSTENGFVRLWMNLGEMHGLNPRDVVGAITNEVGIPGRAIGVIDIRRDFSFVDVSEQYVGQVLEESTGQYQMRGRSVMLKLAN